MTPLRRVSGNQYLHRKSDTYRDAGRLPSPHPTRSHRPGTASDPLRDETLVVWQSFGSWIRTVRPGLHPSEQVVAIALRNTLPEFLANTANPSILVKFIRDRLDLSRTEGTSLAA